MKLLPTYEQFSQSVIAAGLTPRRCADFHWQIHDGAKLVNVWPSKNRGLIFDGNGQTSSPCSIQSAIQSAGKSRKVDAESEVIGSNYVGHSDYLESLISAVQRLIDSGLTIPSGNRDQLEAMSELLSEMDEARRAITPPF